MSRGEEPVIPQESYITGQRRHWKGLTIREHFAGLAMAGLLANPSTEREAIRFGMKGINPADKIAQAATALADALLAEIEDGQEGEE